MKVYNDYFFRDLAAKLREKGYKVYVPVKVKDYYLFKEGDEIDLSGYVNTMKPVKEIIFPQNEVLIKYKDWIEEVPLDKSKKAVLAVRPCDAKALDLLDKVFLEEFVDPYYKIRRDNTLIVSLACKEPCNYGFCINFEFYGGDSIAYEIDTGYAVDALTDKGREVLSLLNMLDADKSVIEKVKEQKRRFEKSFKEKLNLNEIVNVMIKNFDSSYWKDVSTNCISCGICTYLCPTCFCFDILDEENVRYRSWDSCQFPLYTLESSSHNPRAEKWKRLRNRFYDKFVYMYKRKGEIFCVGCGRCIERCPVGIDICEVLRGVKF